jgi:hypothetical protein
MSQKIHNFTIMAGCAPVGVKMLESYFEFHDEKIHVYLFNDDLNKIIGEYQWKGSILLSKIDFHILDDALKYDFKQGHLGTAKVWAQVVRENSESYLIHIDSDVIFKKESLSLIEKAGYPEIYGSRRCYKNNPGKSPVQEGLEDAVSTYFVGINSKWIDSEVYDNDFVRMFQGAYNPLGFPVLDFFDPVFFHMRNNGATVYYEDRNIVGGQDESGSKVNNYPSNLHIDMGSHLAHFGGVGSGYQALKDDSGMNKDYSEWAKYRWYLFDCLFYNSFFYSPHPTEIMDGRWVSGPGTNEIFEQIKKDLNN